MIDDQTDSAPPRELVAGSGGEMVRRSGDWETVNIGSSPTRPSIPSNINSLDRLSAVQFYVHSLGWAIHPVQAPDKGEPHERGKKPLFKGWRDHVLGNITPDLLATYFGAGTNNNIGCVVRPPFVHVDLDSKPDAGASVREWLDTMPELASVPRERTGGGAHLTFICNDIPDAVMKSKKALATQINDKVSAELYVNGLNLVVSPSVHRSGAQYTWEVMGEIPEVKWTYLCGTFGFAPPETKKPGRPPKQMPRWAKWPQDLRTLNLPNVMEEIGNLGECLDPDEYKWAVHCPWGKEHSDGIKIIPGSDTVIFNKPDTMPGFCCLHAHCESRDIWDVIEWAEEQKPGIIASQCSGMRVWQPGSTSPGRPQIILPGLGRPHGQFGAELGDHIAPALDLFRFGGNVVEIKADEPVKQRGAISCQTLSVIGSAELVTAVERTVETGVLKEDEAGDQVFVARSMSMQDACIALASRDFSSRLPSINRLLDVPVPHFSDEGKLVYPKPGYDERFGTWLNPHAPQLVTMGLEEAKRWLLQDLFCLPDHGGFWWHDQQARIHALARFITPFCRGLMSWRRGPLWIFDGNREGCGKDTCADLTHIAYTGRSIVSAPLSKDNDDEMRKRITSALLAGGRFFHLANMKGHVRYASLEAATDDSGVWEDRRLGASETVTIPNEIEFSFSANNATWEPDIERRCRRIRLRLTPDDINSHRYRHPDIKGWVRRHRTELISAVATLVNEWVKQGYPDAPSPFTSFPEWARVVGGIFHSVGLPDPCLPHENSPSSGDQSTRAMREFFALAFARFGDQAVLKKDFQQFVRESEEVHELFDWLAFPEHRALTAFGKLLGKFDQRELGGITLQVNLTSKNRGHYRFVPEDSRPIQHNSHSDSLGSELRGERGERGLIRHDELPEKKSPAKIETENQLEGGNAGGEKTPPDTPAPPRAVFCSRRSDLDQIASDLAGAPSIALDVETYGETKGAGLDPWKGDIRLLTLCRHGGPIWTLDLRAIGCDLGPLRAVLEDATLIAHNAKFDLLWLRVKCGLHARRVLCTLTAARLLVAGNKPGNNLDQCLERYLGIISAADHSRSDWGSMLLTDSQLAYAARDVVHLHQLHSVLETELKTASLEAVWLLECNLLPCVVKMEAVGIHLDRGKLEAIAAEANQIAQQASDELRAALDSPSLNPGSSVQLLAALRAKGLDLDSTAKEALKAADDGTLIPLVLTLRAAVSRATQAETLIEHLQTDGRIHGRFEPLGTDTGRFSSKGPNLQNIGRGEVRAAFTAPEGKRLIVADYSQIELRVAAAIAGETRMINAFKAGADLHKLTAATVLGKSEDQVTSADRQLAKAVNFGLLYGQSASGLVKYAATCYGVTMDEGQALEIRDAFFRTYSQIQEWHRRSRNQAQSGITEVLVCTGRRRLIPETATDWERFTALVNTPVQGGTADGMKLALILIYERLPESASIVSTVHDEVVVECSEESAEECREIIEDAMVEAMTDFFPEVRVEVEANVCTTWAEK